MASSFGGLWRREGCYIWRLGFRLCRRLGFGLGIDRQGERLDPVGGTIVKQEPRRSRDVLPKINSKWYKGQCALVCGRLAEFVLAFRENMSQMEAARSAGLLGGEVARGASCAPLSWASTNSARRRQTNAHLTLLPFELIVKRALSRTGRLNVSVATPSGLSSISCFSIWMLLPKTNQQLRCGRAVSGGRGDRVWKACSKRCPDWRGMPPSE